MIALEIIGAAAAVITIFSAGVAAGRYLSHNQKRPPVASETLGGLNDLLIIFGLTVYRWCPSYFYY